MTIKISRWHRTWTGLLGCVLTMMVGWQPLVAGTVTLSATPPGVTSRVAPNIVVTFDDSGSMSSTSIPDAMDANYTRKYYYSADANPIYFDPTVDYVVPPDAYGMALGTPSYTSAWRDGYCANTLDKQCWSPNNGAYQAPATPVNLSSGFYSGFLANVFSGNSPCPRDFNEPAGWWSQNGYQVSCAALNIPTSVRGSSTSTTGPTSCRRSTPATCPTAGTSNSADGSAVTTTVTCRTSSSCTYSTSTVTYETGGFYYVCSSPTDENSCTYHAVNNESAAIKQSFANWYSYYRTRTMNARAAVGRVFSSLPDNSVRVAWQTLQDQSVRANYYTGSGNYTGAAYGPLASTSVILDLANAATGCTATSTARNDSGNRCWRSQFMNWLYGTPASGGTPSRLAVQAAGAFYGRGLDSNNPQRDPYWNGSTSAASELSCRKNFNMLVTDGYWNNDSPSTPAKLDYNSQSLPDGKPYSASAASSAIFWNDDKSTRASLANIAFNYWATDLRADLNDNVPPYYPDLATGVTGTAGSVVDATTPGSNDEVYFNPANDPATWQHMSQYMVTMGVAGSLPNTSAEYTRLRKGQDAWPSPTIGGGATNIDDTWHAALNGRGGYFSAADPNTLVSSLSSILASVTASSSSALNLSLNAQVLNGDIVGYYAGYNTTNWSGMLSARAINMNGSVGATLWSADSQLTARKDARVIVTSKAAGAGQGVPFLYGNLSSTQQAVLNSADGTGAPADGNGSARVDWLRGVRTGEGSTFRTRTSLLGAIFNSQPVYVGAPSGGYSDAFPAGSPEANALVSGRSYAYSSFVSSNSNRAAAIYVGANDGMLHAFDARPASVSGANPGKELWAYVPASVYANLPLQSRPTNFIFTPTVDGTPVTGDVFFGSSNAANNSAPGWHTILVGSLRYGGRGIFALDITNPVADGNGAYTESTLAQKVLWEFNDTSTDKANSGDLPSNLGYTFGTPVIGRLANNKWAVLLPGGYFPDGSVSSPSYSSLFVIDAQTGRLLKEIRTPAGIISYGLSTPTLGDYDGDQVADVAFAGDILGNVWRFDLSATTLATATPTTGVSQLFQPAASTAQSITTAPRLVTDPASSYFMVVFGTGRYLSTSDTPDTTTQALYGVRDPGGVTTPAATVAALTAQAMTVDGGTGGIGVTSNAVPATQRGWYLPLNSPSGERVVVTPALVAGTNAVVFSTLIPADGDPCTTGSSGSVIALNGATGAPTTGVSLGGATVVLGTRYKLAGGRVRNAASAGSLYTAAGPSGGTLYLPGNVSTNGTDTAPVSLSIPTSRRRSWRVLNNEN